MRARTEGRVGFGWMVTFGLAWLAIWAVQLAPVQLLLPLQLDTPDGPDGWIGGVVSTGIVLGFGGLAGIIAAPLAGALSDRASARIGARRPFAIAGSLIAAVCLVVTGFAVGPWQVGAAWIGVSIGIAVASAAFTALIADQLPESQRASASAIASSAQALGLIVGVATILLLELSTVASYAMLAGIIAVVGIGAALALPDTAHGAKPTHVRERGMFRSLADRDFGWMIAARLVVNVGNALPTTMMLFILLYGLNQGAAAEDNVLIAIIVYTVFVVASSSLSGWWSDRTKRRRTLTVVSAIVQGIAGIAMLIAPSWETLLVAAALIGVGYGGFMTVGLAFATDLLPDAEHNARDLGLVNVSAAFGQILGPLIGAALVAAVGGFWLLFLASSVLSILGGLMNLAATERRPEVAEVL